MDTEWIQNLKAGDQVVVSGRHDLRLDTVTKVTRTQIVTGKKDGKGLECESRYRKSDGREIGGDMWHTVWLEPANEENLAEIKRQNLVAAVYQARRDMVMPKTIEGCEAFLKAVEPFVKMGSHDAKGI